MKTFKELSDKQKELANDMIESILDKLEKVDGKIINFSQGEMPIGFEFDSYQGQYNQCEIVAIGKFDGDLCVISQPWSFNKVIWDIDDLEESDEWRTIMCGEYSLYATLADICEHLKD